MIEDLQPSSEPWTGPFSHNSCQIYRDISGVITLKGIQITADKANQFKTSQLIAGSQKKALCRAGSAGVWGRPEAPKYTSHQGLFPGRNTHPHPRYVREELIWMCASWVRNVDELWLPNGVTLRTSERATSCKMENSQGGWWEDQWKTEKRWDGCSMREKGTFIMGVCDPCYPHQWQN